MAGKKIIKKFNEKIEEQKITDTLELNYMPYAMSVIVSRAIPEIDGFKPSHRKLLYTMYKAGLLTGDRKKSSAVVGDTMKLNPHGDGAIYETLVRLTEGNGALLHPFVDSKGNFGKQYSRDMAYAAPRYTEVKLAPICSELFTDIDSDSVDFIDNFDGSMREPVLLPASFPNILVNPNQGIAVGMASSICSFNLREICETAASLIKNSGSEIIDTLPAPDFSTGGDIIYDREAMRAIYETGRGSFKIRARWRFDRSNSCIEVYEIPYTTNVEVIIDKVIALIKANKIRDITDIRDETDLNGLKIAIDIKKSANPELLMHRLFSMTPLEDSFSCNFNLLINGRPKTLGVRGILHEWTIFRMECVKRSIAFDINKKDKKRHLLEGLKKILLDIDKAIAIIRNTEKEADVVPNLMSGFGIDDVQAEYIAEIRLRNINKEYILNRTGELDSLISDIKRLKEIIGSEAELKKLVSRKLKDVAKKYGAPRRTGIIQTEDITRPTEEELVEDYGVRLFLTRENYFKKIPLTSLRTAPEQKVKEEDEIIFEEEAANRSDILFFSDKQNVYKLKAAAAADAKASSLGDYLPNLLGMEADEKIIYMTATQDYSGYMLFVFENGKAVKVAVESYATKVNRKKLVNAYSSKSRPVMLTKLTGDIDVAMFRNYDKATVINTSILPVTATKNSGGVQVFTLKKNSLISMACHSAEFSAEDLEYYRTGKIPTTGHFIKETDKDKNDMPRQIKL